jgi:uncharacterized protein YuzE
MTMRLEYDLDVGALYIRLSDAEIASTREAGDNAAVDLDAAGGVVGIEVISTAYPWPLADILVSYDLPGDEEAQIRAYFGLGDGKPTRIRVLAPPLLAPGGESPKVNIAPSMVPVPA